MSRRALCWMTAAAVAHGCSDPVLEASIAVLGPEDPEAPPGPLHRAGQPCLLCHDGSQAGVARYTIAGTIYAFRGSAEPAPFVRVELVDARGERRQAETNCAGNFFVRADELEPRYPLWTSLIAGDYRIDMQSRIGRDGSCASCHGEPGSPTQTDPVYVFTLADSSWGGACP